jgi:hypothetical protein
MSRPTLDEIDAELRRRGVEPTEPRKGPPLLPEEEEAMKYVGQRMAIAMGNGSEPRPTGLLNPFKLAAAMLAHGTREQFTHQYPATAAWLDAHPEEREEVVRRLREWAAAPAREHGCY